MKDNLHSLKMASERGMYAQLTSGVYPLRIPLPPVANNGWKPYHVFFGSTEVFHCLSCHVSDLSMDHIPHLPHSHKEEEILLLLAGEVDLIFPDEQAPEGVQRKRLRPGQFVYYPTYFSHTLQTVSEAPANYLMYKWYNEPSHFGSPLAFSRFAAFSKEESKVRDGVNTHLVFEGPTTCLRKLHCHASTLTSGAGYEPHCDPYDVAFVVLEGEIETLGEPVGPHGVIFYRAGEPHGMRNPGETTARYLVFEFHGSRSAIGGSLPARLLILLIKQAFPPPLKRKLRGVLSRLSRRL